MPRSATETNGLTGGMSLSANSTRLQQFTGQWKKFDTAMKDVSEFSKHIYSLENVLDQRSQLESELRRSNAEIASYRAGRQEMLKGFAENDRIQKEEMSKLAEDLQNSMNKDKALEDQLAALKGNSVSKDYFNLKIQDLERTQSKKVIEATKMKDTEINSLRKGLDIAEKKLKKSEDELSNKLPLLIGREEQLRNCQKELEEKTNETGLGGLSPDL